MMNEYLHREKKRKIEMAIILDYLYGYFTNKNKNILEFGCGDGFQIEFLKKISNNVIAIDRKIDPDLKNKNFGTVLETSINDTSFNDKQFDLIFSNHVIEHLEDLEGATQEMMRIGSDDCIYAFSVPTNIWLALSLPAQYYRKIKYMFGLLCKSTSETPKKENNQFNQEIKKSSFLQRIMPQGHGVYTDFFGCYNSFRIKNWEKLFKQLKFNVVQTKPLLLYSASEFPVIPTTRLFTKFGICSSVLFILKKIN